GIKIYVITNSEEISKEEFLVSQNDSIKFQTFTIIQELENEQTLHNYQRYGHLIIHKQLNTTTQFLKYGQKKLQTYMYDIPEITKDSAYILEEVTTTYNSEKTLKFSKFKNLISNKLNITKQIHSQCARTTSFYTSSLCPQ